MPSTNISVVSVQPEKPTARTVTLAAAMSTLVFIATFVPHIPIPLGYAHLGDAVIFLLVLTLDHRTSLIAACLGSALADLLGGFPLWILPTLLIKAGMVEVVWRLLPAEKMQAGMKRIVTALTLSSLWMALAYTLFGALLYGSMAAALASTPGLIMEGVLNTLLALVLLPVARRILAAL